LLRFAGAWGLEEEDLYAVLTRRGLQLLAEKNMTTWSC